MSIQEAVAIARANAIGGGGDAMDVVGKCFRFRRHSEWCERGSAHDRPWSSCAATAWDSSRAAFRGRFALRQPTLDHLRRQVAVAQWLVMYQWTLAQSFQRRIPNFGKSDRGQAVWPVGAVDLDPKSYGKIRRFTGTIIARLIVTYKLSSKRYARSATT